MRRPLIALAAAILVIGAFTGGLAWLLEAPKPPPGASRPDRVYTALCASCHGADGRGSWRAVFFLIRPGDLTDAAQTRAQSDQYLFDIIKHGGAPIGRPGMPGFGFHLSDDEIRDLVAYVRRLGEAEAPGKRPTGDETGVRPGRAP